METMDTLPCLRILLVEDNEDDRLAFRRAFRKSGIECEITECIRAEEACEQLGAAPESFDIVAVDHGLPGMSGLELCKELRSNKTSLPVVLLTGIGSEELAVEALKAGVDDYMVKDTGGHYLELLPVVLPQVCRKYGDRLARERAEEALRRAHEELEQRVADRTAELSKANEQLRREIAERKQAEAAGRESEERYRTVLEASPVPVVVYDVEGICIYINQAFTRVFGWTREEKVGRKIDYVPSDRWPETQMMIDTVRAGKGFSAVDSQRYTKDGKVLDVSITGAVYSNRGGIPVGSIHILQDITDRKRAEDELRKAHDELGLRVKERTAELTKANQQLRREIEERKRAEQELKFSEEKYRLLFSYDPNPLFLVNVDSGKILDVNNPAVQAYEYQREELLTMSFADLFDPNETSRLFDQLSNSANGSDLFISKATARKKDGSPFFTNLHASAVKFEELGNRDSGQSLIVRTVDITRRLEREAVLAQTGKMATLGEMATGVAHEINQPLNVIQVGADFLSKMIKRGKRVRDKELLKVSRNISAQVERATNIVGHLRAFGRKSDVEVGPVDLNEPIRGVFTLIGEQLRLRNIEVDLKLEEDLPEILAENNRLEQVFLNLITNARDALELKGRDATKVLTITAHQEEDKVVATVSDNGPGMPEAIMKKVFDPFFTTKEAGKGTGLGLSITYNLVKDLNGDIEVKSSPGVGTTFSVSFPVHKETRRSL